MTSFVPYGGPLRFGVLGCADIGRKNIRAMLGSAAKELCVLAAVASRSLEKAEAYVKEFPFPEGHVVKTYGSYEELLESSEIDCVYMPLPTAVHLKYCLLAAKCGKHVICEKPCALSATELATITDAFREKKLCFMDGVMFMHNTRLDELAAVLNSPVHTIQSINTHFSFNANKEFLVNNIRVSSAGDPLGALGDLGWYTIRLALLAFTVSDMSIQLPTSTGLCGGTASAAAAVASAMETSTGVAAEREAVSDRRSRSGSITSTPDADCTTQHTHPGNAITMPTHVSAHCTYWGGADLSVPLACRFTVYFPGNLVQPYRREFHSECSFVAPFRQKFEINCVPWTGGADLEEAQNAADIIVSCDDFVIPRKPEKSSLTVERFSATEFVLGDYARCITSKVSKLECDLGSVPQEERMFVEFCKMVSNTRGSACSRGDDPAVGASAAASRARAKWSNWALATQAVVDAALASMKSGGVEVPVACPNLY